MKFNARVTRPEQQQKTCLVVGVYEGGKLLGTAKQLDKLSHGHLEKIIQQGAFQAKIGQILPVFSLPSTHFEAILLVGCGKPGALPPAAFRRIAFAGLKAASTTGFSEVTCYLTELSVVGYGLPWKVKQLVEATGDALYRFDRFKTQPEPKSALHTLTLHLPTAGAHKACEKALKQGEAIAIGVKFTKDLANLPSNICTPRFLAHEAQALAKRHPAVKVTVLDEADMAKLGMGALLAVGQGSKEESRLVILQYHGAAKSKAPIALVGKGVTFDTGGNSLKTPDSMVGMKYDMSGAATVLGTLEAAAQLKLPINLLGVIPTVENMPGGGAYKPEDILKSLSGQTIEVISTDAEGRLILADALTYCERFKPDTVIDIATLTGAVVIALGQHAMGLFSNHQALADALLKAGEESNDRAWQLPLWEEYQEQLNSAFADMANVGGRAAGSITAASFLARFTRSFKWAHLDVAGTAANMINDNTRRFATGRPVPLLMQYLLDRAQ